MRYLALRLKTCILQSVHIHIMFLRSFAEIIFNGNPFYIMRLNLLHKEINTCGRMGLLQLVQRHVKPNKHGMLRLMKQCLFFGSEIDPFQIFGRDIGIVVKQQATNFLRGSKSKFNVSLSETLGGCEIHQLFISWKWIFNGECGVVTIWNPS